MKITKKFLESIPPHSVFASGLVWEGTQKRQLVRWVAKRGLIADWAIYVGTYDRSVDEIAKLGDKVSPITAFTLVDCDESVKAAYRL